jgi:cobalt/nickel transport protein
MSELKKLTLIVALLIAVIVLLAAFVPHMIGLTPKWGGSDDAASSKIGEIRIGYKPWFSPIWKPPSGEIETLLFSLQAAIGAGIIGYVAGLYTGRKEKNRDKP